MISRHFIICYIYSVAFSNSWINRLSIKISPFKLKVNMVATNDPLLSSSTSSTFKTYPNNNNIHNDLQSYDFKPYIPPLKNVKYRINELIPVSDIESIRMRYILVATEEIAQSCKLMITQDNIAFQDLASTISMCNITKMNGGDPGEIYLNQIFNQTLNTEPSGNFDLSSSLDTDTSFYQSLLDSSNVFEDSNSQLYNKHIPVELVNAVCYMNKGDLKIVEITTTLPENNENIPQKQKWFYLVQLLDVQTALSPVLKQRRKQNYDNLLLSYQPINSVAGSTSQMYNYYIETMGCQMNSADSERIEGQLRELGYNKCDDISKSNLIILNTCSIRDHAEQKVYSYLGPHALRKKKGEHIILVIAGCVAQQEGEEVLKRFPEVDIVMGPQYANKMEELLLAVMDGNQVVATNPSVQTEDKIKPFRKSDISGWVNVIYGCNERCTYCVVPSTRGVEQSRTKDAICEEVAEMVALGYKEVVLLGQNIDSWGRDMNPKQKFADLLRAVAAVPGLGRVRFLTSHPKYMSERVVQAVAESKNIGHSFYVPFQSGDDTVLKNMRRGYTSERYLEIVNTIRKYLPDASFTADCIVGFPGETEEQFQNTLKLMEEVKFDMLKTAAYSPRPNTDAATWENQIEESVKQDRLQRINKIGNEHAFERSKRFVGRVENVLVEEISTKNPKFVQGRNTHGRLVYFEGDYNKLKGEFVDVLITSAKMYSLYGQAVDNSETSSSV